MDSVLYASMHDLVDDECNMPCVCKNASMSDNPYDCDAMLHESLGVIDIPNIKLFKRKAKKFQKDLSKLFGEKDDTQLFMHHNYGEKKFHHNYS